MYSRILFPPGVHNVRMKQPVKLTSHYQRYGDLVCDQVDDNVWWVFNVRTLLVEAIFYAKRNTHGWSASESHAKSYINRALPFNPFELDNIP